MRLHKTGDGYETLTYGAFIKIYRESLSWHITIWKEKKIYQNDCRTLEKARYWAEVTAIKLEYPYSYTDRIEWVDRHKAKGKEQNNVSKSII